jgi:hypothetical protein
MARILVRAHPSMGDKVALSERHPKHPLNEYGEHEVFVSGAKSFRDGKLMDAEPVEVAETPRVLEKIARRELVRVNRGTGKAELDESEEVVPEAEAEEDEEDESDGESDAESKPARRPRR